MIPIAFNAVRIFFSSADPSCFCASSSSLKLGQIDEDEYFGRVLYDELVAILKNIKTEQRKDKTTSDGSMIDNLMKELELSLIHI